LWIRSPEKNQQHPTPCRQTVTASSTIYICQFLSASRCLPSEERANSDRSISKIYRISACSFLHTEKNTKIGRAVQTACAALTLQPNFKNNNREKIGGKTPDLTQQHRQHVMNHPPNTLNRRWP